MNSALETWRAIFGVSESFPSIVVSGAALFIAYFLLVLPLCAVLVMIERKFAAGIQARIGPSLTGPKGLLQPLADVLKLLQKNSRSAANKSEDVWLLFLHASLFSMLAALPLGSLWIVVDSEMNAFLPVFISFVLAFATLMLGLEQGTVSGIMGGFRFAAQVIAAALPAIVSVLCVGTRVGSFQWKQIVGSQESSILHWGIFSDPFQWLAFLSFFCAGPILFGFQALDSSLSQMDLNRGVAAQLDGIRYAIFKTREVFGLFLWSTLSVVLFFGAWSMPSGLREDLIASSGSLWVLLIEFSILLVKSLVLVLGYYWISISNPRVRADHLTDFAWKVLSPVSIVALLGSVFWLVWRGGA